MKLPKPPVLAAVFKAAVTKKRLVLSMKLLTPVMLIFMMQLSVQAKSQSKITLRIKKADIANAIEMIEKESDYHFVYNNNLIPAGKKIDARFYEADLPEVMDKLLAGTTLSYKMMQNNLVVIYQGTYEDITVSGKVTDSRGNPLAGATIYLKGNKTKGTKTDAAGNYTITVPDNSILVISYVGYEEIEVAVGGRTSVNVNLKESNNKMDEVVVIGY